MGIKSLGSQGPFFSKGEWTDTITYEVSGINSRYNAMIALNVAGMPHPYINSLWCTDIKPVPPPNTTTSSGLRYYLFDAMYSRSQLANQNPSIKFHFGFITEPCDIDPAGNPIVNSAGDPFNPPTTTDKLILFIDILKRQQSYSTANAMKYVGKVNKNPVTIQSLGTCAPHTLRCLNYAPATEFTLADTNLPILYQFAYRSDNWDRKLLDQGFQAWYRPKAPPYVQGVPTDPALTNATKGKLVYARTPTTGITTPALLNGSGTINDAVKAAYSVENRLTGFDSWTNNPSIPSVSGYSPDGVAGIFSKTTGAGTVWFCPYDLAGEIDFSFFVSQGI